MTFCIFIQKRKFQIWKRKTNWGTKVNLLFVKITSNGKFVNFTQKKRRNDIGIDLLLKKYNQDDVAL